MIMENEEIYFNNVECAKILFFGIYIKVSQLRFDKGVVYGIL